MTVAAMHSVSRASVISLANLLLRETPNRLTIISTAIPEMDPELYVVTKAEWKNPSKPLLVQMPRLLSLLEALRGTRGVPTEVYLDSNDGIAVYLPTGVHISDIPIGPKDAVRFLQDVIDDTIDFYFNTVREVESHFWVLARRRGYSPLIVEKIGRGVKGFQSRSSVAMFHSLLRQYFSIKFRIHTSESCLRVEGPA
ncbi:MAG: hypothetical protein DRO87_13235 [Candidatus Thorarchaeota archaeon]|nr:MAG: hypothetical protein DRO87_13235 [Candidatus Thorarchaeota archaeon]RLI58295.1 MAG: hypothetical protein DRP09_00740 [Candidatus Thorarchaeota archaeon]